MKVTQQSTKSLPLRVARLAPRECATAATMASNWLNRIEQRGWSVARTGEGGLPDVPGLRFHRAAMLGRSMEAASPSEVVDVPDGHGGHGFAINR
jgi:hypothetical protein